MYAFAGNMIELVGEKNEKFIVMSARAFHSLTSSQLKALERFATPLYCELDIIEDFGGGGARCMITANFLPKKRKS